MRELLFLLCRYYDAKIDEILEDGTCAVMFESYGNTDVTEVIYLPLSCEVLTNSLVSDIYFPRWRNFLHALYLDFVYF